jgi:hypothetical protein
MVTVMFSLRGTTLFRIRNGHSLLLRTTCPHFSGNVLTERGFAGAFNQWHNSII